MTESANTGEKRRHAMARKITLCAQRLTERNGLDGFTMDELASACEVSRRTLFNYFPGKVDAVLGGPPEPDAELLDEFRNGGPTGDLLTDLDRLAQDLLATGEPSREEVAIKRRVMRQPRLMHAAHERFEELGQEITDLIREREGDAFDPLRAAVLIRLLVAMFEVALDAYLDDPETRPLTEHYADTMSATRSLFG